MIIDTFMFYNELDMLEFRLKELNHIVDKFILVEATKSFANNNKPLYFKENKSRFSKYLHKIEHIILDDMPDGDHWSREIYQRNATGHALKCIAKDEDIIIASDIDEIPDTNELVKFKKQGLPNPIISPAQDTYYFNIKNKALAYSGYDKHYKLKYHKTFGIKIFYYKAFVNSLLQMHKFRINYLDAYDWDKGGWHLTFFMKPKMIEDKLNNYSHPEFKGSIDNLIQHKNIKFKNIETRYNRYLPMNYKYWL